MSTRRLILNNAIWNWLGLLVGAASAFLIAPFLIEHLGLSGYGLWILIGSLTGYFGLLELGIRGSVGRNLAQCRALADTDGANAILNTALAMLLVPAALTLAGTVALCSLFFEWFHVPPEQVDEVRSALALAGVSLAVTLLGNVFDAVLWAQERFDVINLIDIPLTLLRLGLTYALVGGGQGLAALALITLATTILTALAKGVMGFWLDPTLRMGTGCIRKEAAQTVLGFGLWSFAGQAARQATVHMIPVLIGARLGLALVTPYSLVARVVAYMQQAVLSGAGVLTPLATALHAREEEDRQRQLILQGGKWCTLLAWYLSGFFLCLGEPFLCLWVGGEAGVPAAAVLLIVVLGEALPLSQAASHAALLGMGKPRLLAAAALAEVALVGGFAGGLVHPAGLSGIAWTVAVAAFLCRGIYPLIVACRQAGIPLQQYVVGAFVHPLAVAAAPVLGLGLLARSFPPDGWPALILFGALYTVGYGCCAWLWGLAGQLWSSRRPGAEADPLLIEAASVRVESSAVR